MAPIDFYFMTESPPCRTVEMVANIAGVTLNKHSINLSKKEQFSDDFIKVNSLHRVPFIIDGDLKIGESRAIAAYLVNRYMPEDNTLYPRDPVKRAQVDELLYLDIGTLWAASANLCRPRLFMGVKELDETALKTLYGHLEYIENRLKSNGDKKYLLGDDLTIGDLAIVSTLAFLDSNEIDISKYAHLTAYYGRMKATVPKYDEINGEGVENLRKFIKSKLES